jgi:anaerobic ribonucleoside-triphosphate reductase activating protein
MVPIATWEITSNDDPFQSISLSIYCAGCDRACKGCHSPDLQDPRNGKLLTAIQIMDIVCNRLDLIESVVFLGGEWLNHKDTLQYLLHAVKKLDRKTILYTGFQYEEIPSGILEETDIIIDGAYKEELKTEYKIPATSNQRVFVMAQQESLFNNIESEYYHVITHPSKLPINWEN